METTTQDKIAIPHHLLNSTVAKLFELLDDNKNEFLSGKSISSDLLRISQMQGELISDWLSHENGLEELAWLLNERKTLTNQVFYVKDKQLLHIPYHSDNNGTLTKEERDDVVAMSKEFGVDVSSEVYDNYPRISK
jgi:hypothetical protein